MNNAEIVRGLYTAFAQGNVPAVLSGFAPNIEWREADNFLYADRNPYIGAQAIVEGVFMRLGTEWGNFAVNPDSFHESGDTVFVQGGYTGTLR
ncbi:MAG TPA: nuclear transport factor 2 family protein, partial [Blastocatellia bacterium]|nr:nuclear transport factor 2 family protein [Blastocatellia bacterium]